MRVIAGEARSLPLKTVPSDSIRPTTDKTKEDRKSTRLNSSH